MPQRRGRPQRVQLHREPPLPPLGRRVRGPRRDDQRHLAIGQLQHVPAMRQRARQLGRQRAFAAAVEPHDGATGQVVPPRVLPLAQHVHRWRRVGLRGRAEHIEHLAQRLDGNNRSRGPRCRGTTSSRPGRAQPDATS